MNGKTTVQHVLKLLFVGGLLFLFLGPSTFTALREKFAITHALTNAKSIRLEHYRNAIETFGEGDQIIAAKNMDPKDFHLVGEAFPICLDIGFPLLETGCIFNPHHRIIITDASGNITTIRVCFECDHVEITHGDQKYGDVEGTPIFWVRTLRKFFADEGMPNSPELYRPSYPSTDDSVQVPTTNK